jgi:hypothetical protein
VFSLKDKPRKIQYRSLEAQDLGGLPIRTEMAVRKAKSWAVGKDGHGI